MIWHFGRNIICICIDHIILNISIGSDFDFICINNIHI